MKRVLAFRNVLVALIMLMGGVAYAQSTTEICNDGKDNNGDGKIDCNDSFCSFAPIIEKGCNCFDTKDNDGDGKIDAADTDCATYYGLTFVGAGSTCSIQPPPGTGFSSIAPPQTSSQNTADTPAKVVVGDMNNDGVPDVAVCSKWNSTLQIVATASGSGFSAGDIMSDYTTPGSKIFPKAGSNYVFEHEVLIADINKDKIGEVFAIVSERGGSPNNAPVRFFLTGFTYKAGKGNLTPLFDAVDLGPDRPGNPGIADFDGDGKSEVYLKNQIYAAESGVLLANPGGSWDTQINSGPVAVNVLGDNKLELVCGNFIYSVPSLSARSLQTLTVAKDMNALGGPKFFPKGFFDPTEYGNDQASTSSTADMDGDGFIDVLMTGAINCSGLEASPCGNNTTTIFYWNVAKGTVSTFAPPDPAKPVTGWTYGTGRINLGDANGDGKLEALFIAGNQLFCLGLDASGNLILLWTRTINDSLSGILSLTVYDFNNDGKPEVVYRDSQELAVVDGLTGQNKIWFSTCQSHTWTEGPIVADVNGDGNTDICVTCYTSNAFDPLHNTVQQQSLGQTRLYYSTTNAWLPTRKVWNQHPYYVTNIKDDLTLPFPQVDPSLVFSNSPCPNGLPGPQRPLNLFMNQVPRLSKDGCPEFPAPDLTFTGDNPATPGVDSDGDGSYNPTVVVSPPICGNLNITAYFNIINNGDLPITDNVPVSFYNGDPTVNPATATFLAKTSLQITNLQVGQKLVTAPFAFNGPGTTFKLFIVLYNDGTVTPLPISLAGQSTKECTISNNIYSVDVIPSPVTATIQKISDNFKCSNSAPDNGELRAHVFKGATEVSDYSPYKFQWYTGSDTSSPISAPAGTSFNLSGRAEGTYTLVVTDTQKGCSSVPVSMTINRLGNDPTVNVTVISNQTKCNPPNGQLEANIVGGNTGYTFEWFDVALTPLGIIGSQANGLTAGSYVVFVSKDGCTKASTPVTVNGPQVPDVIAQVLQNVVDCSNPTSGSVQADAVINGVTQSPANYTFNWYFYNNATSTRGSILPPANGSGQTRTGLAAGYYQAEVKDNITQCSSGVFPVVQVLKQTVLPTAQITQIAPQTSCDPGSPNGILSGDALVNGVVQNPSTIKYEWFKGQNTLPANLVATTSGTNGQVVNKVAGGGIPYTIKVTTQLNCSATIDFTIGENLINPVLTLTTLPNSVCDPALGSTPYSGSVTSAVTFNGNPISFPDPNYKFTWYNGASTTDPVIVVTDNKVPVLSGLKEGDYTVIVERADLACKSTPQTKPVVKATVLPNLSLSSTGSNNCDATLTPDGTTTVVVNNAGSDPFTYQWFAGNSIGGTALSTGVNSNNGDQTTAIKLGGPTGAPHPYTVLVTNKKTGCQNNSTIAVADISSVPVLSFLSIVPNSICNPGTNFNGSLTAQVNNIPPGYAVTDYNFKWYNGNSTGAPVNGTSAIDLLNKLDAGFYTVEAKNTKTGCASAPATGQVPDQKIYPAIQITTTGSHNCDATKTPDGTATALVTNTNPGDNFSYAWSAVAPASAITNAINNANQSQAIKLGGPNSPTHSFTYNIIVTNTVTGCISNSSALVADVSAKPTLALQPFPNSVCDKTLITSGAQQFNGHVDISTVTNNIAGSYTGSVTLSYKWFDVAPVTSALSANTTSPTNTTSSLTLLDAAQYAASVTIGELGCTSDPVIAEVLNNLTLPSITPLVVNNTNCPGGIITANGSATVTSIAEGVTVSPLTNYVFKWYDGGTADPANLRSENTSIGPVQIKGTSTFTVQVTNKFNGCQGNSPLTIIDAKVIPSIAVTLIQNNTICDITLGGPGNPTTYNGKLLATPSNAGSNFIINWSGGGATASIISTNVAGDTYATLAAGGPYTAFVKNTDTGCSSLNDSQNILDNLSYPVIAIGVTDQTKCTGTPNGKLIATADGTSNAATYDFIWHDGVGLAGATHVQSATGVIDNLSSGNYTIGVTTISTGCKSSQGGFVPQNIVNPTLAYANVNPVTVCGPNPSGLSPNGTATAVLSNITALPSTNFKVFYVRTVDIGGVGSASYPTDPAIIKTSPDTYSGGAVPSALSDLAPGYLTSMVVDNNTGCESTPNTVQILNTTANYSFQIVGIATAGLCSTVAPGGSIDIEVNRNGVPCATCSYEWFDGTPINSNINFFNNPPDLTGSTMLTTDQDLGVVNPAGGVSAGDYTIVVFDNSNGCGAFHVDVIPTSNPASVVITPTDPTLCVNANNVSNNGIISVQVTRGTGNVDGYTVNLYSGNAVDPLKLITSHGPDTGSPFVVPQMGLDKGDYFIEVIDEFPANKPCPQGFQQTLKSKAFNPKVIVNQIDPNTSCDPLNFADGKVTLTVNKDALDTSVPNYFLSAISPLPVGFVLNAAPGNQIGNGASGQTTGPMNGFKPQSAVASYTITVTDDNSKCFKDIVVSVPDVQDVPSALNVIQTPETFCAPASNGKAVASLSGGESTSIFDFSWYKNNNATSNVTGAVAGDGAGTAGELINQSKVLVPADWNIGTSGSGSGDRIYFVQGIKNASAPTGRGCKTEIRQVLIADQHLTPDMTLTAAFNSFCNAIAGGALGDGKITIAADADPTTAGQQNAAGGFDYQWTNANGALTSPQTAQSNNFIIPQLGTGNYLITATNATNKCIITNSITIDPAPYNIAINTSSILDQRICRNDGQVDITRITLTDNSPGGPNTIAETNATLNTKYDFKWYLANPATPGTFNSAAGQELTDFASTVISNRTLGIDTDQIAEAGEYQSMAEGTYYVIATRKDNTSIGFGCPSLPYRVDVKDIHQLPFAELTPLSNTSCLLGTDEGEIKLKVVDNTAAAFAPFTFTYTWSGGNPQVIAAAIPGLSDGDGFGGGDNDGIGTDNDEDHPTQLTTGVYNLTILNNQSGCQVAASTEIIQNAIPVFVQDVDILNQVLCGPDGSMEVTKVTLNDRFGTNQTSGVDFNISDFQFIWTKASDAYVQTTPGTKLSVTNYDASPPLGAGLGFSTPIGAGTYTVTAKRLTGRPGAGCASAPFTAVIQDKRIFPVVVLTPYANTSCDPAFFEGEVKVNVTDASINLPAPLTGAPFLYDYNWTASATPSLLGSTSFNNDGDGFGGGENDAASLPDNDGDHPKALHENDPLNPSDFYTVAVTNTQTGCVSAGSTRIFRNSTPVFIPDVSALPQVVCNADGQLQINEVTITNRDGITQTAPLTDFDYYWSRTSVGNQVAITNGINGIVSGGTILDKNAYTTIGTDSYFVVAKRVSGAPGKDCSSAPYKVDIDDERNYPTLAFTSITNSSCSTLKPNGTVIVFASEQTPPAIPDNYNFVWTLDNPYDASGPLALPGAVSPSSIQTDTPPDQSKITNAIDGSYSVTVTNTNTGCPFTRNFDLLLDQTKSTPNIIDVLPVYPLDCNPSASATVTKITLGSQTNSLLFPPNVPPNNEITGPALATFIYEWSSGSPSNIIAGEVAPAINSLTIGSYFVTVQDPTTDCKSGPKEVVIDDHLVIYPAADISQTAKQISCLSTFGTAYLAATGDGQSGAPYTFTWFPSLDNTGTVINPASTSTISNLIVGNYSVTVLNTVTGCTANAAYIVPDDAPYYTPVVSLGGQPRTLCVGQDGEVLARVTNLDSTYPFPLNFTSSLYYSASPDFSTPANVPSMAAVPGFPANFIQSNLAEGFYTVRILDNNTGCVGVATNEVKDNRTPPIIVIAEDNPMTNCDPLRANGQLSATADGGKVGGYTFDWYAGTTVSSPLGTLIISDSKLIGQRTGDYVVRVTTQLTGCTADQAGNITDKTIIPPVPIALVVQDRTNCINPNGWVTANVAGATLNYDFHWYDGASVKSSFDFDGIDYQNIDIGPYTVTATDLITGCISPPASATVKDKRVYPKFTFETTPSYCADTGKPKGIGTIQLLLSNSDSTVIEDVQWYELVTSNFVGRGTEVYDLFPGLYKGVAISIEGCNSEGIAEVKTEINPYNGVSVNGDAQNDYFIIDCITNFPDNNVKIFNRSGILVYEINGYDNADFSFKGFGKEGLYLQGKELPVGTYFYIIDKRDGSKPLAGYLELDR